MPDVKGMIQHEGATYRIVKVGKGKYDVIRILDEIKLGSFETIPKLRVQPQSIDDEKLLLSISLNALKQAKISWQNLTVPRVPKSVPATKMPSSRPPRALPSTRLRVAKPT
jgi:hypothetical protein